MYLNDYYGIFYITICIFELNKFLFKNYLYCIMISICVYIINEYIHKKKNKVDVNILGNYTYM